MEASANYTGNIEVLLDVPVKLTVELGSCQMPMRDVLQLSIGSVVQLDRIAEAPVDLYVNHKKFALGEVVVVDDRFGIKITEVLGAKV
jgi:flagellar motor switch protein FliN